LSTRDVIILSVFIDEGDDDDVTAAATLSLFPLLLMLSDADNDVGDFVIGFVFLLLVVVAAVLVAPAFCATLDCNVDSGALTMFILVGGAQAET